MKNNDHVQASEIPNDLNADNRARLDALKTDKSALIAALKDARAEIGDAEDGHVGIYEKHGAWRWADRRTGEGGTILDVISKTHGISGQQAERAALMLYGSFVSAKSPSAPSAPSPVPRENDVPPERLSSVEAPEDRQRPSDTSPAPGQGISVDAGQTTATQGSHVAAAAEGEHTLTDFIIDKDFRRIIPPLSSEEYGLLENKILAEGFSSKYPLIVWHPSEGSPILLDGHHRFKICAEHKIEYECVEQELADREEAIDWILKNQLGRRNVSEKTASKLRGELYNRIKRRKGGQPTNQNAEKRSGNSCRFVSDGTREEIANELGVSSRTIHNDGEFAEALNIIEDAIGVELANSLLPNDAPAAQKDIIALSEEPPEKQHEIVDAGKVKGYAKRRKKEANLEAIRNNPEPPPEGPFDTIAIDPPWRYDTRADDDTHRGRNPYVDMSVDEIKALPVADLAHKDCVLFLWFTNAFVREALECLDAWGFTYKTFLTWDKVDMGVGDWLRNVTEHCFLAVRGKAVVDLTNQTTLIREKRREHSRKPEAFYKRVEELCPGSKLELFSRETRPGWQAWGSEKGLFDEREAM